MILVVATIEFLHRIVEVQSDPSCEKPLTVVALSPNNTCHDDDIVIIIIHISSFVPRVVPALNWFETFLFTFHCFLIKVNIVIVKIPVLPVALGNSIIASKSSHTK